MRSLRTITPDKPLEPSALRARFRITLEPARPGRCRHDEQPMSFTPTTTRVVRNGWRWITAAAVVAGIAVLFGTLA